MNRAQFRDDVVHAARNREPGVTITKISKDLDFHPITLTKWMRRVDIDDGGKPGMTGEQSAQLREANRRIRLMEQRNEVLRWAAADLSQANLPGK